MSGIKNIVFSGGGIKIFIFAGCLKYLDKNNLLDNLHGICGTSTGSIISTALSLGYNLSEITELLIKIDFNKFSNIKSEGILNFFENFGIDNTDEFERVFKIVIKAKTSNENITFKELYELTNKKLIIYCTNLNCMECEYFDYIKTPDFKIIDALIASISIPFLYSPKKINDIYYVDGALTNHYPIEYFEKDIENTIGFMNVRKINENVDIRNLENYFFAICLCSSTKLVKDTFNKFKDNTIVIESDQNIIEFDLSIDKKYELINFGYELTKEYFEKKQNKENKENIVNVCDRETQTEDILEESENIEENETYSESYNDVENNK